MRLSLLVTLLLLVTSCSVSIEIPNVEPPTEEDHRKMNTPNCEHVYDNKMKCHYCKRQFYRI